MCLKRGINMSNETELLGNYASFLESTLKINGYNFANGEIMEVTDAKFDVASDFLGCSFDSGRIKAINFRVVTEDILDKYLNNYEMYPDVNIIYSQVPFYNPVSLIKKLSLVPIVTPAVAIFGAYGFKKIKYKSIQNLKYLDMFTNLLVNNNLNYDRFYKQNNKEYFELIVARNDKLYR